MIDEKEKQDGMKACFDHRVDDKVEREFMRDPLIAYTRAFDDAIGWFKKALWHDASEIPKGERLSFSWQNRIVQSIIMLALCTTLWITIKTANGGA